MNIQFHLVGESGVSQYAKELRTIEQDILYPLNLSGDYFSIIHGESYSCFFSQMGKSRFILVLDGQKLIGVMAAVWKNVSINNQPCTALYLADLKLAKPYRGKSVTQKLIWFALKKWLTDPECRRWDFVFAAAMQRSGGGDVTYSFKKLHPGKLIKFSNCLDIYFTSAEDLLRLGDDSPMLPPIEDSACLSLSDKEIIDNTGLKDFKLQSTGEPWPLVHLSMPVKRWSEKFGSHLKECAEKMLGESAQKVLCFSLDSRLLSVKTWLNRYGIFHGAACNIHSCPNTLLGQSPLQQARFIHLDTSQI